jgi:cell division septal protein FtsQ
MWFDDEDVSGRRLFKGRRKKSRLPILSVNTKLSAKRKRGLPGPAFFALVVVALAAAGVVGWFALMRVGEVLFSKNERFIMRNLDVKVQQGAIVTPALVREWARLREGENLFDFNIAKIRNDLLRWSPNVKSVQITRRLPDTLALEVSERIPLARMASERHLVVDDEGVLFGVPSRGKRLPVIAGYDGPPLRRGRRVQGAALAGLAVLDACGDPDLRIDVATIDVSHKGHLTMRLVNGKTVKLSWKHMGEATPESRRNLKRKLRQVATALHSREGRGHSVLDATYENRIYGQ